MFRQRGKKYGGPDRTNRKMNNKSFFKTFPAVKKKKKKSFYVDDVQT